LFNESLERRNTHSMKWDLMEKIFGVSQENGISMWVADSDFRAPECVMKAMRDLAEFGVYGYYTDTREYDAAIGWWMRTRHGWDVAPHEIFTASGLVNAVGLCLHAFSKPGDGVVLFTPVYHAFARVINGAGRQVVECPLVQVDGRYEMDFAAYDAKMTGNEKIMILCSPHNPGGRVWSAEELRAVVDFAKRHDLLLISDEVHHDLVYPGHKHIPMPVLAPEFRDRLVILTAASKTFNVAGLSVGNVIIQDEALRVKFSATMTGLGMQVSSFGMLGATAAYSPEGAAWADAQVIHLDENRRLFDSIINTIPGVRSMALESTYLAWVDFSGTGMSMDEIKLRVHKDAQIAASHGDTFGAGGEAFLRFNIATRRSLIEEAGARLQKAFADLQ
jgi:cystathionine beta-lyase